MGVAVAQVSHVDLGEDVVDEAPLLALGDLAELQRQCEVVGDGHVWPERVRLEDQAEIAAFGGHRAAPGAVEEDLVADTDGARVGVSRPATHDKVVDLPQPDGPSRVKNSPSATVKLTSSRTAVPWKDFLMFSTTSSGMLLPLQEETGEAGDDGGDGDLEGGEGGDGAGLTLGPQIDGGGADDL